MGIKADDLNVRAKRFVDLDVLDRFFNGIDNFVEYVDKMWHLSNTVTTKERYILSKLVDKLNCNKNVWFR